MPQLSSTCTQKWVLSCICASYVMSDHMETGAQQYLPSLYTVHFVCVQQVWWCAAVLHDAHAQEGSVDWSQVLQLTSIQRILYAH